MNNPGEFVDDVFMPGGKLRLDLVEEGAVQALQESLRLARETGWDQVRSPHVFMGLLAVPDAGIRSWGERLGADLPRLLGQFQELFNQELAGDADCLLVLNREFLSDNVLRLLRDAYGRAVENQRPRVTP